MAELAGRVVVAGDHGTGQQRSICEGCWGRSPQTGRWVGGRAGKGSGRPFVLPGVGEPRELSGNRQRLGNCAGGSGQGPRLQPQLPASPLRRVFTALVGVAGGAGRSLPGGRGPDGGPGLGLTAGDGSCSASAVRPSPHGAEFTRVECGGCARVWASVRVGEPLPERVVSGLRPSMAAQTS